MSRFLTWLAAAALLLGLAAQLLVPFGLLAESDSLLLRMLRLAGWGLAALGATVLLALRPWRGLAGPRVLAWFAAAALAAGTLALLALGWLNFNKSTVTSNHSETSDALLKSGLYK